VSKLNQHYPSTADFTAPGRTNSAKKTPPEETKTASKSGRTFTHKVVCYVGIKNSLFGIETSFKALGGLERKMNYCKSSVKLGMYAANAKERHAISSRVVTHTFWQLLQSLEDRGSRHTSSFFSKVRESPTT
jgi:hypothetical protein